MTALMSTLSYMVFIYSDDRARVGKALIVIFEPGMSEEALFTDIWQTIDTTQ